MKMHRLLFTLAAALALVLPANALAATKTVNIYGAVFKPATVNAQAGDAVRWVNRDNAEHQIVADRGTFASPILKRGQAYTFVFKDAGTFGYKDVLGTRKRGKVVVKGAPPTLTLGATAPILVYGTAATLSGTVSNGHGGETVTISAQPYGAAAPQPLATVTTGTGGGFAYNIQPDRLTTYVATWQKAASTPVTVQVRPKVSFMPFEGRMYTKVTSPAPHAGAYVYLQRLTSIGWITAAKYRLGPLSGRVLTLPRRCGTVTYRIYLSSDQAGAGYLDSWSGTQKTRYKRHCHR